MIESMNMHQVNSSVPVFQSLEKRRFGFSKAGKTCCQRWAPWIGLAMLGVVTCTAPAAQVPRLAIVTKERDAAISDLVFSRLSQSGDLALVERDRLASVLQELELSPRSRGNDVKAGSLLSAQGLLFIETDEEFRHFILVESSRGERLFDLVRPKAEPPDELVAGQVCRQVLRFLPQLATQGRPARHIAVLPFEREDGGMRWHNLDVLTVLVGNTLAQHPQLIVVERQNLSEVVLETAVAGGVPHVGTNPPTNVFNAIYGTGTNRFHYYHDTGNAEPRLIVNSRYSGCDDLPTLNYKWLLMDSCHSGTYYSDSFNHGVFFYTYDLEWLASDSTMLFVKAVIEGQSPEDLCSSLNSMHTGLATHYPYKEAKFQHQDN